MNRRPVGSLGRRISWWLALQSLIGLAAVCLTVYTAAALSLAARHSVMLTQKQALVQHFLGEAAQDNDLHALKHKLDDFLLGHADLGLLLRQRDGVAFYESAAVVASEGDRREARFEVPSPVAPAELLYATMSLDVRPDNALLQRLAVTLLASAIAGALMISVGGFLLVERGLKPVHELVEQTRRLAVDHLQRLDGSAQPAELQPLIAQFNALLGRLGRAYEQLEGFNADVAHELCTPLATLISSTELALRKARSAEELREVLGSNLEELHRMSGIVQDMLFLSEAEHGATARRVPTESLAAVAAAVVEYHEAALEDAGLRLEVVGDAAGDFDVPLLQRALSNLLSNATRYATRGTAVRVEIATHAPGEVRLGVVNRGLSIEPEHLPRLFDRFYRTDQSRRHAHVNHGLGLAIVAAIARMHRGHPFATSTDGVTSIGLTLASSDTR